MVRNPTVFQRLAAKIFDLNFFAPLVCHPDRSGQHFPALVFWSAGRAVEGPWLPRSATQVNGTKPTNNDRRRFFCHPDRSSQHFPALVF